MNIVQFKFTIHTVLCLLYTQSWLQAYRMMVTQKNEIYMDHICFRHFKGTFFCPFCLRNEHCSNTQLSYNP